MISIIVSTYRKNFYVELIQNIAETIGETQYEVVPIENDGQFSICEAYNKGAEKSKYDYLLFIHEDVEFETRGWGKILTEKYFTLPNCGILGLAGNRKKFHLPGGVNSGLAQSTLLFLRHKGEVKKAYEIYDDSPIQVKVVDGVFLAMKREVWKKLKFDETIKGFHFYDIDISLRAAEIYQNYLIHDFYFVHFSKGNFGKEWLQTCIKFNKRNFYKFDNPTKLEIEQIQKYWYTRLFDEKISFYLRLLFVLNMKFNRLSIKYAIHFLIKNKQVWKFAKKVKSFFKIVKNNCELKKFNVIL